MNPKAKLRGNPEKPSELTRLKQLWRQKLTAAQKETLMGWHDDPKVTNEVARQRLQTLFGIKLERDGQLSDFWSWVSQLEDLQSTNDLLENFEEFTRKRNPDWTPERVRSNAIEFFIAHTVRRRDPSKFAQIMQLDQAERFGKTKAGFEERKISLSEQKWRDGVKTKLQAGLDAVAEAFKGNAKAMEFYSQARKMIAKETS